MLKILKDDKGIVFVLVLSVVTLFMAVVMAFRADQGMDLAHAHNFKDMLQAQYLGNAGIEAAITLLLQDDRSYDAEDEDWAKFSQYLFTASSYLEGMIFTGTITDECSKIDLNSLVKKDGDKYVAVEFRIKQLKRLMMDVLQIEIKEDEFNELAAAIVDWLDPDDEPGMGGAESDYYQSLDEPYAAKNGPFDTPEEILLVRGMKPEWFNGNEEYEGIGKYVTVGTQGVGAQGKINFNTASKQVLMSLAGGITEDMVERFMDCRPIKNLEDVESCKNKTGLNTLPLEDWNAIENMAAWLSTRFSVDVKGAMPSGAMMNVRATLDLVNNKPQIVYYRIY